MMSAEPPPPSMVSVVESEKGVSVKTLSWQLAVLRAGSGGARCSANVNKPPTDGKKQSSESTSDLLYLPLVPLGAFPGKESTFHIPDQNQKLLPGPGWSDTQGQ